MTRRQYIERIRRAIYGGQPPAEANITVQLVNKYLEDAIGVAAKANYTDNLKIDGIAYVNNSFYTTFKTLTVTNEGQFLWKIELPHIPVGLGYNEGVSTLVFKDNASSQLSKTVVWLNANQKTYFQNMRPIPNKVLAYYEGKYVYVISQLVLSVYTANVTMVSGGLSTSLDSELNVPPDYFPIMDDYLKKQLMFQRNIPQDNVNDGVDLIQSA